MLLDDKPGQLARQYWDKGKRVCAELSERGDRHNQPVFPEHVLLKLDRHQTSRLLSMFPWLPAWFNDVLASKRSKDPGLVRSKSSLEPPVDLTEQAAEARKRAAIQQEKEKERIRSLASLFANYTINPPSSDGPQRVPPSHPPNG